MVLRLFVPPGEGQHKLVPKRPDPIGANATLQYAVIGSTALAATYTSFAFRHGQRVTLSKPVSRTALFIRSSARLGLWAGAAGAAINWYYHTSFVGVVAAERNNTLKPWKLYEWTKQHTVDDGLLTGAALGLAASLPTLFMRRPAIPRWTRCLGMTNIGACTGLLAAHGYFHHTRSRQTAYARLDTLLKRRSIEFWAIFWDKQLMARFDPLTQQYIRHNGIWHTYHLPDEVYDDPDAYAPSPDHDAAVHPVEEEDQAPYYTQPYDYADDLRQINVAATHTRMTDDERELQDLLREAEFLMLVGARKEFEYCHLNDDVDDGERQLRREQIHLLQIAYNRVRAAASTLEVKLAAWALTLQHKAAFDAGGPVEAWLPRATRVNWEGHDPVLAIGEMERFREQIGEEVRRFEELERDERYGMAQRERWRADAEDGRGILRAVDAVVWEFEERRKRVEGGRKGESVEVISVVAQSESDKVERVVEKKAEPDKPVIEDVKPSSSSLEPEKP